MNEIYKCRFLFLVVLLARTANSNTDPSSNRAFDKYSVYRVHLETEEHHRAIRSSIDDDLCSEMNIPHHLNLPADILCSPENADAYLERLSRSMLNHTVMTRDFGRFLHQQTKERERISRLRRDVSQGRQDAASCFDFTNYQGYDTIISCLEKLAADNPSFVQLIEMGRSVEDRKIYAIKIGTSPLGDKTRAVFIDGGIHAREWIAISTASYMIDKLVNTFKLSSPSGCDNSIRSVDWYVAPLLNPDGYEYSRSGSTNRLWRKNRAVNAGSDCVGVDLNRNFGTDGYGTGASPNPCSETFKGPGENSEPETKALQNILNQHKDNIRVYISFHSYSQLILTSFGWTTEAPRDINKLTKLGNQIASAIKCVNNGRNYPVIPASGLYPAGGASDDFAKITAKIPYSFTIELPDTDGGSFGFLLPPSEIEPVGAEWWNTMTAVAQEAALSELGPDPAYP